MAKNAPNVTISAGSLVQCADLAYWTNCAVGNVPSSGDMPIGTGTHYYVSKSGSDAATGLAGAPFLTIQKALNTVSAGDTVDIGAGTYTETSTVQDGDTPVYFSIAVKDDGSNNPVSGTISEPITLRASAGDEGLVIIDGEDVRGGFHANRGDYYNVYGLKFINTRVGSIRNYSQSGSLTPTEGKAQGWRVINNEFDRVRAPYGVNSSHIAMWATEDWIVENNIINDSYTVTGEGRAAGVMAYGAINALIKNNTITNTNLGIYWKDHFVADGAYTPVINSEISYNLIDSTEIGVLIHGANEQAGSNNIHHNIFTDYTEAAVKAPTKYGDSPVDPTDLTIEHNLFSLAATGASAESTAIYADEYKNIKINGNIFASERVAITMWEWSGEWAEISECDYNVYGTISSDLAQLDYNYGGVTFANLAAWQAATSASATSLLVNNPDSNGLSSTLVALFTDAATGDYTHKAGSPALGAMLDGSNAGPYQLGTEMIGSTL